MDIDNTLRGNRLRKRLSCIGKILDEDEITSAKISASSITKTKPSAR